jgi:hypothetical protein
MSFTRRVFVLILAVSFLGAALAALPGKLPARHNLPRTEGSILVGNSPIEARLQT